MRIDNFALALHQTCPAKYDLRIRQSWSSRGRSPALAFGAAMHAGLAEWYRGRGLGAAEAAIESAWDHNIPPDDWRTLERCIKTMQEYASQYPDEFFEVVGMPDSPIVERTFTLRTGLYLPCECERWTIHNPQEPTCNYCGAEREPIEWGGIFDALVESSGLYVLEHKTTAMLNSTYMSQFKPNNQLTGYVWAATQLSGRRVVGSIINVIAVYRASPTKFERTITTRNDFEIQEWLRNVYHTCVEIRQHEQHGYWPMRTQACTLYGLCEFHAVHSVNDPVHRQKRLEQDYIQSVWDYERRD